MFTGALSRDNAPLPAKTSLSREEEIGSLIRGHIDLFDAERAARNAADGDRSLPRVTVITPSFNQAEFLERTIRSVLNQGWPHLEYIVIDGGSGDGSPGIIRKYEDYLAYWVSEPDSGQGDALAKGLARSTGKYVTWVCSDDILLPGALEALAAALEARPDAGIAYGAVAFLDESDRVLKLRSYPDMSLRNLLYDRRSTIAQPSSLMRKKTVDEAGGIDPSLSYAMDYDLWIRILKRSGCVNLGNTVLSGYRLHTRSKTVGSYRKMALEKIRVNRRHTNDRINRVIYAHSWYIVEDTFRRLRRKIRKGTNPRG